MKLHCVVSETMYEGGDVEGIYTSKEKAQGAEKLLMDNKKILANDHPQYHGFDRIDIFEFELDAIPECIQVLIDKGKKVKR